MPSEHSNLMTAGAHWSFSKVLWPIYSETSLVSRFPCEVGMSISLYFCSLVSSELLLIISE